MLKRLRRRLLRLAAERRRRVESTLCVDRQAYRRARNLLRRCLTPAQRLEFDRRQMFTVRGASGTLYRIRYAAVINVEVLTPAGAVDHRLCAGPAGVPTPSVMLAQKLMLESDEAEFLRIALRHPALPRVPLFPHPG